jgi:hypothetical protein
MMIETRDFPTADVLSVATGKLLSNRRMDGLCDLVAWLTREAPIPRFMNEATTRRLLTAAAKARDLLIWQHPWLIDTQPPAGIDNSELLDWLLAVEAQRGEVLTIVREEPFAGLVAAVDSAQQALIELASALRRGLPGEGED